MQPKWLYWAKQLQSLAQAGIEYTKSPYDRERYERIRALSIEIMQEYTDIDQMKLTELFASEKGYQTPKIDVRAAIFRDDHNILMVREKHDNRWAMPGGWADIELSLSENIIKESLEEAGAEIRIRRLIGIFDRNKYVSDDFPFSAYKIFVQCDFIRGEFAGNTETLESGFFGPDNLPDLSEGRNTEEQIRLCFKARQEESFEAIID